VAVAVHNIGPPIPKPLQTVIFDAFRTEASGSGSGTGSVGLGLFITREILHARWACCKMNLVGR
jgi:signal transduction histidine kinase